MSGKITNARKGGSEATRYIYLHFSNKGVVFSADTTGRAPVWIRGDSSPPDSKRVMLIPPDTKATDTPAQLLPEELHASALGWSLAYPQGYSRYWVSSDEKNCTFVNGSHVFLNGEFVYSSTDYVEAVGLFKDQDTGKEFLYVVASLYLPPPGGRSYTVFGQLRDSVTGALIRTVWHITAVEQYGDRVLPSLANSTPTVERVVAMSLDGREVTWVVPHTYTLPSKIYTCKVSGGVARSLGPVPSLPVSHPPTTTPAPQYPVYNVGYEYRLKHVGNREVEGVITPIYENILFTTAGNPHWGVGPAFDTSVDTDYKVTKSPVRAYYDSDGLLSFVLETQVSNYKSVSKSITEGWRYYTTYNVGSSDALYFMHDYHHKYEQESSQSNTTKNTLHLWRGKELESSSSFISGEANFAEEDMRVNQQMDAYDWFWAAYPNGDSNSTPTTGYHENTMTYWRKRNHNSSKGNFVMFLDPLAEMAVVLVADMTTKGETTTLNYHHRHNWPFGGNVGVPPQYQTDHGGVAVTTLKLEVHVGASVTSINLPVPLQALWGTKSPGSKTCLLGDPYLKGTADPSKEVLAHINCVKYGNALIVTFPTDDPADPTHQTTLNFSADASGVTLRMVPDQAIIGWVKNVRLI